MARQGERSQHQRLDDLLRRFGQGTISSVQFWLYMDAYKLTQDDIDLYCSGQRLG